MEEFPSFEEAVEQFKAFIGKQGHPTQLNWVFRDDLYVTRNTVFIVSPLPSNNRQTAQTAYNNGVAMGQVEIRAMAGIQGGMAATIWYPTFEANRPEGWDHGLRFSIAEPLREAQEVGKGWRWNLRKYTPAFRRFHRFPHHSILKTSEIVSSTITKTAGDN